MNRRRSHGRSQGPGCGSRAPPGTRKMARPEGFEPPTLCLEGRRSFQLSYGRVTIDSKTFVPRGHAILDALVIVFEGGVCDTTALDL